LSSDSIKRRVKQKSATQSKCTGVSALLPTGSTHDHWQSGTVYEYIAR
jgi:hypothetical protein